MKWFSEDFFYLPPFHSFYDIMLSCWCGFSIRIQYIGLYSQIFIWMKLWFSDNKIESRNCRLNRLMSLYIINTKCIDFFLCRIYFTSSKCLIYYLELTYIYDISTYEWQNVSSYILYQIRINKTNWVLFGKNKIEMKSYFLILKLWHVYDVIRL